MKLVIQRVRSASVHINDQLVGAIGKGAVVLVAVAKGDTEHDARYLAGKTAKLRMYDDADGRMNAPLDADGAFLVISQFTLYGDCAKGNRPSYIESASPVDARALYEGYVTALREYGHAVETGRFQEDMLVELQNDGPVTLILESRGRQKA